MRKSFPQLGELTADIRVRVEEDNDLMNDIELKWNETRQRLINEGTRDEMKLLQPSYAPDLNLGMKSQCAFRCTDEDAHGDEIIEWYAGIITIFSDGNNSRNPGKGPRHFINGSATEVQWDADVSKGEEISFFYCRD